MGQPAPREESASEQHYEANPYQVISPELDAQTIGIIRSQLEMILQSEAFLRSKRMQKFLSFTVNSALRGLSNLLKEGSIARNVFDRGESFNPCLDPIVRVEVGRLRSKLRQYYLEEGKNDIITIIFPKRSYVPIFRYREAEASVKPTFGNDYLPRTMAILPFTNLSPQRCSDQFCDSLTEELTNRVGRLTGLRVVARTSMLAFKGKLPDVREIGASLGVDAVMEGSVQREGNEIRISIALVDVRNGYRLWTNTLDLRTNGGFDTQEMIAREVTDHLNRKLRELRLPD